MADTIVNTPSGSSDNSAGWAVAAVLVVAILLGGFLLYRYGLPGVPNTGGGTNINVELPSGGGGSGGGSGGSGGGGSGGGSGSTQ